MLSISYLDLSDNRIGDMIVLQLIKKIANPVGEDIISKTVQINFQNNIRNIDFIGLANTQITDTSILGF